MTFVAAIQLPEGVVAQTPQEAVEYQGQGYEKCRNQLCPFMISPKILYEAEEDPLFTCPWCSLAYDLRKAPGKPGGMTNSGLDLGTFAQIGEDVVEQLGELPGYGPILWMHKGGATSASHLDGAVAEWGLEIKTINWASQNLRAIVSPKDRVTKNRAASDPKWFADVLGDESLAQVLPQLNFHGVLGVLVLLDFFSSMADVYVREMPLSSNIGPKKPHGELQGVIHFRHNVATLVAERVPFENPLPRPSTSEGVSQQPQQGIESELDEIFSKTALDYAGDSHPAEEPQLSQDREDRFGDNDWTFSDQRFTFVLRDGKLEMNAVHGDAPAQPPSAGPGASGVITVDKGRATWQVSSNIGLGQFAKIAEDYTKQMDWQWGGITDLQGKAVADEFAPREAVHYVYDRDGDHLYLAARQELLPQPEAAGVLVLAGSTLRVPGLDPDEASAILEWAADEGYTVLGANDNVIKTIEDLQQWNMGDPDPDPPTGLSDRDPMGLFKCRECGQLFARWRDYLVHMRGEEGPGDDEPDSGFPEIRENPIEDAHFTPTLPEIFPVAYVLGAKIPEPKDLIDKPVPVLYDIDADAIYVGHPGAFHSEVDVGYSPGEMVQGTYEPGGQIIMRTRTNAPYSFRHMLELWQYQHPEFAIKGISYLDDEGNEKKLAAETNTIDKLRVAAQNDPAAWTAYQALKGAGAKVYVVGGAVRDTLMGNDPKDIDLLAQGMPSKAVERALKALPGRVDLTGKDFGVFRYRNAGHEVEIALPRRERSTGEGHKDFDVQTDYRMPIEGDLQRRDFTVNAMAMDLDDGELIDPYNGQRDIEQNVLRAVSEQSFEDDPLRIVRGLVAHSRFGLIPDTKTRWQMAKNADRLKHLPGERIQAELDKIMASRNPSAAIELAHDTGVLGHFLPEVEEAWDFDQNNPHHNLPLGQHLLEVLNNAVRYTDDPDVRLAALLHDVGKPASAWTNPDTGFNHYYRSADGQGLDHDEHGAGLAAGRMEGLRYPRNRIERVRNLVQHHMFPDFSSSAGARKFLNRVGEHADDLLVLRSADREGKGTPEHQAVKTPVDKMRELVQRVRAGQEPTDRSQLAISGKDLIDAGMAPGPDMGLVLNDLTQKVLEDPTLNNREKLLEMAGYGS